MEVMRGGGGGWIEKRVLANSHENDLRPCYLQPMYLRPFTPAPKVGRVSLIPAGGIAQIKQKIEKREGRMQKRYPHPSIGAHSVMTADR